MSTTDAPTTIDILDRDFWRTRQHDVWTWARANDPVLRDERTGIWAITKHADVMPSGTPSCSPRCAPIASTRRPPSRT